MGEVTAGQTSDVSGGERVGFDEIGLRGGFEGGWTSRRSGGAGQADNRKRRFTVGGGADDDHR